MGKSPAFYLPCFWDIRQIILNHLVEWVKQSCRNSISRVRREISKRIVFCKKMSGLIYLFRTVSEKIFGLLAFLSASLSKFFSTHREEMDKFVSWKKDVFPMFPNTEKTLMQSSKLLSQLHQNCLSRALSKFFVKTMFFFVKFHQSSFWDIFWKKLRTFGELFLAFIMFFASLTKMFSMSPEERLRKLFPKQWVFPFLNIERKENRIFGGCFRQVSQNCSFLVQMNNLRKSFSTRKLFSTFSLMEWWKFGFWWVFCRRLFKSFSLRQK